MTLDEFDHAILEIVQQDNQRSHASIGAEVNLSASSVRRRLKAMREEGVIIGDVSLTNPSQQGLSFIVHVAFEQETEEAYRAFQEQMSADPAVSQCYYISGDFDMFLIVHAVSPEAYDDWGAAALMANPAIRRYTTSLVWRRTKFTSQIKPAAQMQ